MNTCKPENYPDGCGWSNRATFPRLGHVEWWCDACERDGDCVIPPEIDTTQAG